MDRDKYKELEKNHDKAVYLVGFVLICIVGFFIYKTRGTNFFDDPTNWGIFGDYVGGTLNPILGFFSFMLLLLNLYFQRQQLDKTEEQLKLNQEELKLTREELKKAADAQIDSAKVMNEQLKTQFLQQFDSSFFSILDRLTILLNEVEQDESIEIKLDNLNQDLYSTTLTSELGYKKGNFISLIYLLLKNVKGKLITF